MITIGGPTTPHHMVAQIPQHALAGSIHHEEGDEAEVFLSFSIIEVPCDSIWEK